MDILLVNASPKAAENNSAHFLEEIKNLIGCNHKITEVKVNKPILNNDLIQSISVCDVLVLALPLYIDSLPSHLTNVLLKLHQEVLYDNKKPIRVYAVVNCGFYEGKQTHVALQMLKNWCNKTGLIWCQGLGIGAGEMLGQIKKVPLGHGPKKSLGKAFILFSENIAGSRQGENMYVSPDFPRFLFKIMADSHWNSIAKSLGVKKKDIFQNTL